MLAEGALAPEAIQWAALDSAVWQIVDTQLGGVPSLRVLAAIPCAVIQGALPAVRVTTGAPPVSRALSRPQVCSAWGFTLSRQPTPSSWEGRLAVPRERE